MLVEFSHPHDEMGYGLEGLRLNQSDESPFDFDTPLTVSSSLLSCGA